MSFKKTKLILIACLLLLSACAKPTKNEPGIAPFSFTNQDDKIFGTAELENSIWIANFIFTNCTSVCAPMSVEMANLQELFKEKNIEVELVSFTVDPLTDSPIILKEYANNFTNDLSNWNLLTGYSQKDIEIFARNQFKSIVQKPSTSDQVIHSSNFYLVDRHGQLVNEYNYIDSSYKENILQDIQLLIK